MLTVEQLAYTTQCSTSTAVKLLPHVKTALKKWQINTPRRIALFLAQLGHESAQLSTMSEGLYYSAPGLLKTFDAYFDKTTAAQYARQPARIANRVYANRMGNGNEASGDGYRYRGSGYIQLTFKNNFREMSKHVGVDLVANPDRLRTDPALAMDVSGAFWYLNGLNELADKNDVLGISRKINLGTLKTSRMPNGLADRMAKSKRGIAALVTA